MRFKQIAFGLLSLFILFASLSNLALSQPSNPLEFNEGLVISGSDFEYHTLGENKTVHFHVFDQKTGVLIPDEEVDCHHHLYRLEPEYENINANGNFTVNAYGISLVLNDSQLDKEGLYGLNIRCNSTDTIDGEEVEKGGFARYDFKVREYVSTSSEGSIGRIIWTCPSDWTFPVIYMVLTILVILSSMLFKAPLFGVFGGVMLIFSYLYIGACSPLLLSPLLIIGILLTIRFAITDE